MKNNELDFIYEEIEQSRIEVYSYIWDTSASDGINRYEPSKDFLQSINRKTGGMCYSWFLLTSHYSDTIPLLKSDLERVKKAIYDFFLIATIFDDIADTLDDTVRGSWNYATLSLYFAMPDETMEVIKAKRIKILAKMMLEGEFLNELIQEGVEAYYEGRTCLEQFMTQESLEHLSTLIFEQLCKPFG